MFSTRETTDFVRLFNRQCPGLLDRGLANIDVDIMTIDGFERVVRPRDYMN